MAGSSAETITSPPLTPTDEAEKNGSAATLRPTCFMHTRARAPAMAAPVAASMATFSFGDHSQYTSS